MGGRRMIVAKVNALGFEFAPVVGQTYVSPQAPLTKKRNSETGSWQARAVQKDVRRSPLTISAACAIMHLPWGRA